MLNPRLLQAQKRTAAPRVAGGDPLSRATGSVRSFGAVGAGAAGLLRDDFDRVDFGEIDLRAEAQRQLTVGYNCRKGLIDADERAARLGENVEVGEDRPAVER